MYVAMVINIQPMVINILQPAEMEKRRGLEGYFVGKIDLSHGLGRVGTGRKGLLRDFFWGGVSKPSSGPGDRG